jgi:hypothetical protein
VFGHFQQGSGWLWKNGGILESPYVLKVDLDVALLALNGGKR